MDFVVGGYSKVPPLTLTRHTRVFLSSMLSIPTPFQGRTPASPRYISRTA